MCLSFLYFCFMHVDVYVYLMFLWASLPDTNKWIDEWSTLTTYSALVVVYTAYCALQIVRLALQSPLSSLYHLGIHVRFMKFLWAPRQFSDTL